MELFNLVAGPGKIWLLLGVFGRGKIKGFPSSGSQKGEIKVGSVEDRGEILLDGSVWEDDVYGRWITVVTTRLCWPDGFY